MAQSLQKLLQPRPPWVVSRAPTQQTLAPVSKSASHGKVQASTFPQTAGASNPSTEKNTNTPDPSSGAVSTVPPPDNATGSHSNVAAGAPPQLAKEHVFLGVRRGMDFRVVDIEVQGLSDFAFFCALKERYAALRGNWRLWVSWWRFVHCDYFVVCLACATYNVIFCKLWFA